MKKWRSGFTMIEIMFFLGITGLLFMGVLVGTQTSISQQRSYDSVQSFTEFLRSVYSGVNNPQSTNNGGRSEQALYGKMVIFSVKDNKNQISVYDVIGNVNPTGDGADVYRNLKLNVKDQDGFVGIPENYTPKWQTRIETKSKDSDNLFEGTILVLRHPRSGTINTLFSESVINVDTDRTQIENSIRNAISGFKQEQIDFCVNSLDNKDRRTDIRLVKNTHNASGIQIIDLDSADDECK